MAYAASAGVQDSFQELDEATVSPFLWKVLLISGMGFFTDAYDLFIIGVVVALLKTEWHLTSFDTALLNSTTLIASAIGALVFGRVADLLGRKRIYGFEVLVLAAGAIASAFSPSIAWLVVFRFILGLGIGGDYPVSATIMSEYAGKRTRGMMVGLVFGMQGLGLIVGPLLAAGLLSSSLSHDTIWRILLALGAIPGLSVFYLRRQLQETPRWAALHGDRQEAQTAVKNATGDRGGRAPVGGREAQGNGRQEDALSGFAELASNPRLRKWLFGTSMSWFLMDFAYYGNTISSPAVVAAIRPHASLLANTLITLLIFVAFAIPGYILAAFTLDRLGRKTIQTQGFIFMFLVFGAIGVIPGATKNVVAFVILFGLSYFFTEFGPNTTTFVYPAEIFPLQLRTTSHGIAAALGKIGGFAGAFAFPFMISNIKLTGAEAVVALVSLAGLVVTVFFLPEPKGRSLEEISEQQETENATGQARNTGPAVRAG
jgi:MFS family permease